MHFFKLEKNLILTVLFFLFFLRFFFQEINKQTKLLGVEAISESKDALSRAVNAIDVISSTALGFFSFFLFSFFLI